MRAWLRRAVIGSALAVGCGGAAVDRTASPPAGARVGRAPEPIARGPVPVPVAVPEPAPLAPDAPSLAPLVPVTLDTHVDTTQRMLDDHVDVATRVADGQLDLPRMREGAVSGAFFSIWVNPRTFRGEQAWQRAQALVAVVRAMVDAHPDEAALCTSVDEVRRANASGRIAVLMGVEGAHALGDAPDDVLLERLRELFRLGARYMTITWTNDNRLGHASSGAHPALGLTDLGRRAVREMNGLGMIVDVSHVSDRTALDVLDVSTRPVLASHSSARALADHPRNVSDVLVRRIAEQGGAVCVNFYPRFIDVQYGARARALEHVHATDPTLQRPSIAVLADHFAHIVQIGGPGAACIGSDFDGIGELPDGMRDVRDLPRLFDELSRRGLDLAAIRGENVLRVLGAQATTSTAEGH